MQPFHTEKSLKSPSHSSLTSAHKRYRVNPIEGMIFLVSGIIFLNSLYHLLYDNPTLQFSTLASMNSNSAIEGRSIASLALKTSNSNSSSNLIEASISDVHIECNDLKEIKTTANKIRLSGILCGALNSGQQDNLKTSSNGNMHVINKNNKQEAISFINWEQGTFITEYINLNLGDNLILVDIDYHLQSKGLSETHNTDLNAKKNVRERKEIKIQRVVKAQTEQQTSISQNSVQHLENAVPKFPNPLPGLKVSR